MSLSLNQLKVEGENGIGAAQQIKQFNYSPRGNRTTFYGTHSGQMVFAVASLVRLRVQLFQQSLCRLIRLEKVKRFRAVMRCQMKRAGR